MEEMTKEASSSDEDKSSVSDETKHLHKETITRKFNYHETGSPPREGERFARGEKQNELKR